MGGKLASVWADQRPRRSCMCSPNRLHLSGRATPLEVPHGPLFHQGTWLAISQAIICRSVPSLSTDPTLGQRVDPGSLHRLLRDGAERGCRSWSCRRSDGIQHDGWRGDAGVARGSHGVERTRRKNNASTRPGASCWQRRAVVRGVGPERERGVASAITRPPFRRRALESADHRALPNADLNPRAFRVRSFGPGLARSLALALMRPMHRRSNISPRSTPCASSGRVPQSQAVSSSFTSWSTLPGGRWA